jgi:excisionase family DNA binding protein
MNSDLLTVSEVARILRVDDTTVRRWVKQGALEAVVLPHVNARQAYRVRRQGLRANNFQDNGWFYQRSVSTKKLSFREPC